MIVLQFDGIYQDEGEHTDKVDLICSSFDLFIRVVLSNLKAKLNASGLTLRFSQFVFMDQDHPVYQISSVLNKDPRSSGLTLFSRQTENQDSGRRLLLVPWFSPVENHLKDLKVSASAEIFKCKLKTHCFNLVLTKLFYLTFIC